MEVEPSLEFQSSTYHHNMVDTARRMYSMEFQIQQTATLRNAHVSKISSPKLPTQLLDTQRNTIEQMFLLSCFFAATCPNPDDNSCLINGVYQCIHDPDKDCILKVRKIQKCVQFY